MFFQTTGHHYIAKIINKMKYYTISNVISSMKSTTKCNAFIQFNLEAFIKYLIHTRDSGKLKLKNGKIADSFFMEYSLGKRYHDYHHHCITIAMISIAINSITNIKSFLCARLCYNHLQGYLSPPKNPITPTCYSA